MRIKLPLIFALSLILHTTTQAQQGSPEKSKAQFGLEGTLGMSVGKDIVAFNVGGPAFMFRLTKEWKAGIMAAPSFIVRNGNSLARLGIAPRIQYKRVSLILPLYEFNTVWYMTAGLSYQFSK